MYIIYGKDYLRKRQQRTQYDLKPSAKDSTSDLEATPRTTAKPVKVDPHCGNETNNKCVESIFEASTTPVSDRVAAMEGAIPRMSTILEDSSHVF